MSFFIWFFLMLLLFSFWRGVVVVFFVVVFFVSLFVCFWGFSAFYENNLFNDVNFDTTQSTYNSLYSLLMCNITEIHSETFNYIWKFRNMCASILVWFVDISYQCSVRHLFLQCFRPIKRVQVCKIHVPEDGKASIVLSTH